MSRREFIKAGVAGLGVAAMGGVTEKVFGAPAVIKGTKLAHSSGHLLHRTGPGSLQETSRGVGQAEWGHGER